MMTVGFGGLVLVYETDVTITRWRHFRCAALCVAVKQ
jgi:hypothetical protein